MFLLAGGVIAIICFCVLFLALLACWVYGFILCLRASILLFILCLLLHVPFVIFGLVKWLCGVDLARKIADAFC